MLSILEEEIERSIYTAIRLVLVAEGYLPDITDSVRYPINTNPALANAHWDADLKTITTAKGFAIELFGYGSSDAKGTKRVPRITIESSRVMPSEIGSPTYAWLDDAGDNTVKLKQPLPFRASTFGFEIHLVGNSAAQVRVLNAVLGRALGLVKYLPFVSDPTRQFFLQQINYYEVPDPQEGIEEKIYSYEAPDLYDTHEDAIAITKMKQITIDFCLQDANGSMDNVVPPNQSVNGGQIHVGQPATGGHTEFTDEFTPEFT
jgi:hypothetical protein